MSGIIWQYDMLAEELLRRSVDVTDEQIASDVWPKLMMDYGAVCFMVEFKDFEVVLKLAWMKRQINGMTEALEQIKGNCMNLPFSLGGLAGRLMACRDIASAALKENTEEE